MHRGWIMIDYKQIMENAKANRDKLELCEKHYFKAKPPYKLGQKITCQNCGGTMSLIEAFRYTQGFKAAGLDPNEVFEEFE